MPQPTLLEALADVPDPRASTARRCAARFPTTARLRVALVAAYLHRERRVLDRERVENGDELGAVRRLLLTLPVAGRLMTGDFLQTKRDVCRTLVEIGGRTRCPSRATSPA